MIKLQCVRFEGLDGFGTLDLRDLGQVTSFTGPNGAGKTSVLMALRQVYRMLATKTVRDVLPKDEPWHRADRVELLFTGAGQCILDAFDGHFHGQEGTIIVEVLADGERFAITGLTWGGATLKIGPLATTMQDINQLAAMIHARSEALAQARVNRIQIDTNRVPNDAGHFDRVRSADAELQDLEVKVEELLAELERLRRVEVILGGDGETTVVHRDEIDGVLAALPIPGLHFVNPHNFFDEDVPKLVRELVDLKKGKKAQSRQFESAMTKLSRFIQADVDIWEQDGHADMYINGVPYQKASSGTKVSVAFFAVTRMDAPNRIVVWDEPENGLHPTRRSMVLRLMLADTRQFIVATHTPEFVPLLSDEGRTFRCDAAYEDDALHPALSVRPVANRRDAFEVLEALGVHPARTLFTANVVIWVEGPTELLFYRHWLALRLKDKRLYEGFHYTFAQYGGALINYLSVADDVALGSTFDVLSMSRHPVVLVDSDFREAPHAADPVSSLKRGAAKLHEQLAAMGGSGLFQWTTGREIENYLPGKAILHAASQVWSGYADFRDALEAAPFAVGQYAGFADALEALVLAVGATDKNGKAMGRSRWGAANKVEMMQAALTLDGLSEGDLLWECSMSMDRIEAFIVDVANAGH